MSWALTGGVPIYRVTISLTGPKAITSAVVFDPAFDARDWHGTVLDTLGAPAGNYNLVVQVWDCLGRPDRTGTQRTVVVTP